MPQLIFYVKGDYPQIRELVDDTITLGRGKENKIRLRDSRVSIHHAELSREQNGTYRIKDLGSYNGTIVNGDKVQSAILKNGDRITFGPVRAVFMEPGSGGGALAQTESEPDGTETTDPGLEGRTASIDIGNLTAPEPGKLGDLQKAAADLRRQNQDALQKLKAIQSDLDKTGQKRIHLQTGLKAKEKELATLDKERHALQEECNRLREAAETSLRKKQQLQTELATLGQKLEGARKEVAEKQKVSEKAEAAISETRALETRKGELESELEKRRETFEKLGHEIGSHSETLDKLAASIASKRKDAEVLAKVIGENEELIRSSRASLESVESEHKKHLEDISRKKEEQKALQEKCDELTGIIEEKTAAVSDLEKEIETRRKERETAIAGAKEIEAKRTRIETELNERNQQLEEIGKQIGGRNEELEKLNSTIASQEQKTGRLAAEAGKQEEQIRVARDSLGTIQKEISQSRETKSSLEEECASLSRLIDQKSAFLGQLRGTIDARTKGEIAPCPSLRVIYPGMKSLVHYFHGGAWKPEADLIAPFTHCSLTACTGGSMHRESDSIPAGEDPVFVLLEGNPDSDIPLIESISREMPDHLLLAAWEEGSLNAGDLPKLRQALERVAGLVSFDPATARILEDSPVDRPHLELPLPCPLDLPEWHIEPSNPDRPGGIFVSAPGFDQNNPLHRSRLELVNRLAEDAGAKVTVYLHDRPPLPGLKVPAGQLTTSGSALGYDDYLSLMSGHRLVTGFGTNSAGGSPLVDALVTGTVFLGSDFGDMIEELLFPDTSVSGDKIEPALKNATAMLSDQRAFEDAAERARSLATQHVSFNAARERLGEFIASLGAGQRG